MEGAVGVEAHDIGTAGIEDRSAPVAEQDSRLGGILVSLVLSWPMKDTRETLDEFRRNPRGVRFRDLARCATPVSDSHANAAAAIASTGRRGRATRV